MKKFIHSIIVLSALASVISGCSMSAEPTATVAPVYKPAAVVNIFSEYALLAGHTLYAPEDGAYSIQIPEGSEIDSENPDNVTITVKAENGVNDLINIEKSTNAPIIETEAKLMDLLKDDDSIDITGFFLLKNSGEYKGYKYSYTAMEDNNLKGIKSTYFSNDGTAYVVTATINNGNDEIITTNINTVVDTFVNNK